jgi:bacillithiol system protein YtxJ
MKRLLDWLAGMARLLRGPAPEENLMQEITSQDMLEKVLEKSASGPVFLFKHSTTCPVSASAYRRAAAWIEAQGGAAPPFYIVKVIESRPVSNEIASRLGVTHQSPQLLLLKDREAVWNVSHGKITEEAITAALENAGG